ncbi:MAG: cyclase family protein, partial [Solirubrobacteraceae bacterium]
FKKIVDLAVPMTSMNTPVYPGYPQPLRTTFSTIRDNGYESYVWTFVEHVSTHVDAPVHMVAGGVPVDKMPLSHYVGHGVVLDFSKKPKRFQIRKADVEKAIKATGHAGEIGKGWIVLFHLNYTSKNATPDWMEHPDITKEAAEYLAGLGIEAVGIDAPGPDHAPFEAHKALLPKLTTNRELSGLLNRALDGLDRLRCQNGFTRTATTDEAGERFRIDADSAAGFCDEGCMIHDGARIAKPTLFKAYKAWCEENNRRPLASVRFSRRLRELHTLDEIATKGTDYWLGVELKGQP